MSRLFCSLFGWLCVLVTPLCAQSSWTAVNSGTTRTLLGVCAGGTGYVAVGEGGTILTSSPDGLTWTPRNSGTTRTLTAVAWGHRHYVAVGEAGTILTSPDGITWQDVGARITKNPKNRLNAVRFTGNSFYILGEHDAAVDLALPAELWSDSLDATSGPSWRASAPGMNRILVGGENGLAWLERTGRALINATPIPAATIRDVGGVLLYRGAFFAVGSGGIIVSSTNATDWARQPSSTTANLNALAEFNGTLVAVGGGGTILSLDSAEQWQRETSPTTEALHAIAADGRIIVGANGTILRGTSTPRAPVIVTQPVASASETNSGSLVLSVRATGSEPLQYQWFQNGRQFERSGQSATLQIAPFTGFDRGTYTVKVFNSAGEVTSTPVEVQDLPRPSPIVDASFRPTGSGSGDYVVTAILPLPDESLLVASAPADLTRDAPAYVMKYRRDGQHDTTWSAPPFIGVDPPAGIQRRRMAVTTLLRMSDGRILAGGTFDRVDVERSRNLVRLKADGSFDNTFLPPDAVTAAPIRSLALQSRNRVLVANGVSAPVRLDIEGQIDSTFQPYALPPEFPITGNRRDWMVHTVQVTSDDRILLGADIGLTRTVIAPLSNSTVIRLQPDGALDSSFTQLRWVGYGMSLRALDDGGVLAAGRLQETEQGNYTRDGYEGRFWRLRSDGTPLPGYAARRIGGLSTTYLYPDGRALYATDQTQNPVRLTALGAVDDTFTGGIGRPQLLAASPAGDIYVAGNFTLYNAQLAPAGLVRLLAGPNTTPNAPKVFGLRIAPATAAIGDEVGLSATVSGSADLTYEWKNEFGAALAITQHPSWSFKAQASTPRGFQVVVHNPRGSASSEIVSFNLLPAAPTIERQPTRISTQAGRDVYLQLARGATSGNVTVEWRRNGVVIPNPGGPWSQSLEYDLSAIQPAQAGTYTVTVRNIFGESVTSDPIVIVVDETSRFVNLSTRVKLDPREPRAIIGFTLGGGADRIVIMRGAGPSLTRFGVADPLARPAIELFDSRGVSRYGSTTSGWSETLRPFFERTGAFPFDSGSADAAMAAILPAGGYTVVLTAPPGEYGSAVVEIYEADKRHETMLNLSTRAFIAPDAPATAGFVVRGAVAKPVLVRAAGPTLLQLNVPNALHNPRLVLRNERGEILGSNDDWDNSLRAAMNSVGAFPFENNSRDAALRLTLPPGNYTAAVESADTGAGVALVEVYEFPP